VPVRESSLSVATGSRHVDATRRGAQEAIQIVNHFHPACNLTDAAWHMLERRRQCINRGQVAAAWDQPKDNNALARSHPIALG